MQLGLYGMVLVLSLGESAGTDVLGVALAPDLECPKPAAVLAALEARLAPHLIVRAADSRARYRLSLRAEGGLVLELWENEASVVARTLTLDADECGIAADTVALITSAWLRAPRPPPPSAAGSEPAPETPSLEPADALAVARSPQASARAGVSVPASARPIVDRLALQAAGGAIMPVDPPNEPVATVRLGVEGTRDLWLLGLRGQLETARSVDTGDAVSVRHSSLELAVGRLLARESSYDLAAVLGGGIEIVSGDAGAFLNSDPKSVLSPVAMLGLRLAYHPFEQLGVFASVEVVASLRRERFVSEGETVGVTPRARSRLVLGASWDVF